MKQIIFSKFMDMFSRKFIGVLIASVLLYLKLIDQVMWMSVLVAYMGANIAETFINGKKGE